MVLDVHSAIDEFLRADKSDGSVCALVSGRIHEGQLPNDGRYPALRYVVVTDPNVARLQTDNRNIEVQFDIYGRRGTKAEELWPINKALFDRLNRSSLDIEGYNGGQVLAIDRGRPVWEPDVVRIMSRYRIWANQ